MGCGGTDGTEGIAGTLGGALGTDGTEGSAIVGERAPLGGAEEAGDIAGAWGGADIESASTRLLGEPRACENARAASTARYRQQYALLAETLERLPLPDPFATAPKG